MIATGCTSVASGVKRGNTALYFGVLPCTGWFCPGRDGLIMKSRARPPITAGARRAAVEGGTAGIDGLIAVNGIPIVRLVQASASSACSNYCTALVHRSHGALHVICSLCGCTQHG